MEDRKEGGMEARRQHNKNHLLAEIAAENTNQPRNNSKKKMFVPFFSFYGLQR